MKKSDVLEQASTFTGDQIRDAWSKSKLMHLQMISTNKSYRALPKSMWDSILAEHLSLHEYVPEYFDCDAFATLFMAQVAALYEINGVCRVLDSSAGHSYNAILVSEDGKTCTWTIVEPQADVIVGDPVEQGVTVTTPDGAYRATQGFAVTI